MLGRRELLSLIHQPRRSGQAIWRLVAVIAVVLALPDAIAWNWAAPIAWAQDAIPGPPDAPGLSAPADGTMLQDAWGEVTLQWNAVPGAADYQVIFNDGERTGPWVTETSWSPGSLPDGSYRWTVRARNAAGVGIPGSVFTFSVTPVDGAPELTTAQAPLEPLPLQLQQQAQQGEDGVSESSSDTAMENTTAAPVADAAAATPAAGTPVPVAPATTEATGETGDGAIADPAAAPADNGEPAPSSTDVIVAPADTAEDDGEKAKDKDKAKAEDGEPDDGESEDREPREKKDKKEREPREPRNPGNSNGNGGVSEVIAEPPSVGTPLRWQMPVELPQQDATDATAGSVGESGTVNGQPRETADTAPPELVGPGAPGEVLLPPSVPSVAGGTLPAGVTSPNVNPALATGVGATSEMVFDAASDTTVFTSAPGSPQSEESAGLLAVGGPQGAVALISFDISGIEGGTVLAARLTFSGGGETGAPGGRVGIIYGFMARDGMTANAVPSSDSALNVHGAPAWFEAIEPGGLTAVDVSGSISEDGKVTFVLPGQPDTAGAIYALESGVPPQLILTVAAPA
jgi:hypothetical protein